MFWKGLYGYLIAFFFYIRGFIYFVSMYFFQEKSEALKFWFHMIALSLGSALLVLAIFGQEILSFLGWIVLFISVAGGAYLGYDGYGGYRIYRQNSKALQEPGDPACERLAHALRAAIASLTMSPMRTRKSVLMVGR